MYTNLLDDGQGQSTGHNVETNATVISLSQYPDITQYLIIDSVVHFEIKLWIKLILDHCDVSHQATIMEFVKTDRAQKRNLMHNHICSFTHTPQTISPKQNHHVFSTCPQRTD